MKSNQKNFIKYISENTFSVIAFNENGSRYSSYIGAQLLNALAEMSKHAAEGRRVLLLPASYKTGSPDIMKSFYPLPLNQKVFIN